MNIFDHLSNKFWRTIPLPKVKIKSGKNTFKVPRFIFNHFYKSTFQSENWLYELLSLIDKYRPLDCVIDVGVNIGQTLLHLKSINPLLQYVGFEPNPNCCAVGQQIIQINNFEESYIIPLGLSDRNQLMKMEFNKNDYLDSSATLIDGFRSSTLDKYQFVNVSSLDKIWNVLTINHVDLMKIDIEGAELEAFRGMKQTIKKYSPIIIIEVLPSYNLENHKRINRQKELAQLILNSNYQIYHIKNKQSHLEFKSVTEFPIHNNVNESDYILIPADMNVNSLKFN